MKKMLQFIIVCILFIPLLVNAETCNNDKVTISTITVADKSNNVEELNNATTSNNNININLNMSNVGDNIKYKFIVNNDSNDDYYLNKNSIKVSSNYVDYNIEGHFQNYKNLLNFYIYTSKQQKYNRKVRFLKGIVIILRVQEVLKHVW